LMSLLEVKKRGDAAVCTLQGSGSASLLSVNALRELHQVIDGVLADSGTSAVIITGGNNNFFSAGADLRELSLLEDETSLMFSRLGQSLFEKMEQLSKPIIAAVDGFCMGGGLDLLLACDLRFATPGSTFAHPGSRFGIITGFGGTVRLPAEISYARASDIFISARVLEAQEALEIGLINGIIGRELLLDHCLEIAKRLNTLDRGVFRLFKQGVVRGLF